MHVTLTDNAGPAGESLNQFLYSFPSSLALERNAQLSKMTDKTRLRAFIVLSDTALVVSSSIALYKLLGY